MKLGNQGFTLLEVVVVSGLVAVLAAIARPTYLSYKYKSMQSHAKTELSAIYLAQEAFRFDRGFYFGDFREIGYRPSGPMIYRVGFGDRGWVSTPDNFVGDFLGPNANAVVYNSKAACSLANFDCHENPETTANLLAGDFPLSTVGSDGGGMGFDELKYRAAAQADINPYNPNTDQWAITQDKVLTNIEQDF